MMLSQRDDALVDALELRLDARCLALNFSLKQEYRRPHRTERIAQLVGNSRHQLAKLGHLAFFDDFILCLSQFLHIVRQTAIEDRNIFIDRLHLQRHRFGLGLGRLRLVICGFYLVEFAERGTEHEGGRRQGNQRCGARTEEHEKQFRTRGR